MENRLKEIMSSKGISSVALAEMMKVSKVTISSLITGKTSSLETFARAAECLNVELWELFVKKEDIVPSLSNTIICPHCGKEIKIKAE